MEAHENTLWAGEEAQYHFGDMHPGCSGIVRDGDFEADAVSIENSSNHLTDLDDDVQLETTSSLQVEEAVSVIGC